MSIAPLSDNAPQTTPSSVDDNSVQAQPSAQPSQPSQPTQSGQPQFPAPRPNQPSTGQPTAPSNPHKGLFDRVLQGMAGGPSLVTDPHTGVTTEVPMTRSTITKHILAAAITGIISGAQVPPNPNDPAGTRTSQNMAAMGQSFNATQAKMQQMKNAPQAAMDLDTQNKKNAMTNNLFELQNQVSIGKLHEEQWDQAENYYNKLKDIYEPVIQNIETADKDRAAGSASLFVDGARGISYQDAMKQMEGHHGEYQAIQDGFTTQDIGGRTAHVPTYSLVRNSGQVNVDRNALGVLAQYNSDIANLLAKSSVTSVPMSITQLLNIEKDAHQGQAAEAWINNIRAGIDKSHEGEDDYKPLGKVQGFNAAYKDDSTVHSQVDQMMTVLGSYGTHSTVSALDELMKGQKGGALMPFFTSGSNLTKDDLQDFVNGKKDDVAKQDSIAKSAGAQAVQDKKSETALDIQGQKAAGKAAETAQTEADLHDAAKNILGGDVSRIADIVSYRGNQRTRFFKVMADEARAHGMNPNDYSPAMLKTKSDVIEDFGKGKSSDQLVGFNTFLGHANDATSVTETMRKKLNAGEPSPLLNRPLKWLAQNAENDTDYQAFMTALVPVRKEYMSFLNANRAEHEDDIKVMNTVLSDTASPAQIEAALKQLEQSAAIRVSNLGRKYSNTLGVPYPNLVSPEGIQAMQRAGIQIPANITSEGKSQRTPQGQRGPATPTYATNPQTKQRVMTVDGGKTWNPAPAQQ